MGIAKHLSLFLSTWRLQDKRGQDLFSYANGHCHKWSWRLFPVGFPPTPCNSEGPNYQPQHLTSPPKGNTNHILAPGRHCCWESMAQNIEQFVSLYISAGSIAPFCSIQALRTEGHIELIGLSLSFSLKVAYLIQGYTVLKGYFITFKIFENRTLCFENSDTYTQILTGPCVILK